MLLSLISLSCQVTLLYLWSYLHISMLRVKMESFPESSHFLASLNLPIWCYRKGTGIFSLNNSKMLSVFPPFAVGSSWPRWDFSWKNLSALAPVSSERSQPRVFFHIPVQSAQPSGILTKALLNAHFILFEMCPAHSTVLGSSTPLSHRGERAISNGLSQWEKPKFLLLIKGQIHSPASAGTSWQWG